VIVDGHDGRLVDFFDSIGLAETVADVLEAGPATLAMRNRARVTVRDRYDLTRICLPAQLRAIRA